MVAVLASRATRTIIRSRPPGGLEPPEPKVRQLAGGSPPTPIYDPCRLVRKGKQIPTAREAWLLASSRSLASGWASQPGAWGIPTGDRVGHRCRGGRNRVDLKSVGKEQSVSCYSLPICCRETTATDATTGSHRARAQSAAADGARNRNRIEATETDSFFDYERLDVYRNQIPVGADCRDAEHDMSAK